MMARLPGLLGRLIARMHFRPYPLLIAASITVVASAAGTSQTVLILLSMPVLLVTLVACVLWPARWAIGHWVFRSATAVPLALIIAVSVIWTGWPLRGHFLLVRPIMDSMADRLEKGENVETPVQVGLLRVQMAEVDGWHGGVPCLWTDLYKGGYTGFVRTTSDKVDSQFNLWSNLKLDRNWQFIEED